MSEPTLIPDKDLQWVDEVAALLPEESRLGWYQNVRPWLRMLPPEDEVAHLAYSMGFLALLTRSTPALIAAERSQIAPMVQRHIEEMTAAVKSTTTLHRKLDDRLSRLPGEIAAGLSPDALAAEIVARAREQFLASGIPAAGRLMREQGDEFRKMVAEQSRTITALQQKLDDSGSSAERAFDRLFKITDTAENSIKKWNQNMYELHWAHMGLTLLIGFLLGALLVWSTFRPPMTNPPAEKAQQLEPIQQPSPGSRKTARRESNDQPRKKEH